MLVRQRTDSSSSGLSIKTPRTARFAEATSVNSPTAPTTTAERNPYLDLPATRHLMPQAQPSDVGFGYMSENNGSKHNSYAGVEVPLTPNSPLKSALKPPGTPGRLANPLSPTFREEQILEKHEDHTEKANAKDVVRIFQAMLIKRMLIGRLENQNPRPNGQDVPTWDQLQLQSYCVGYAVNDLFDLQRFQIISPKKQSSTLGLRSEDLASNHTS